MIILAYLIMKYLNNVNMESVSRLINYIDNITKAYDRIRNYETIDITYFQKSE